MTVKEGDTIAVWFSCGIASAAALMKTVEKYHDCASIRVLNNPIAEEDEDNQRFLRDVAALCNVTIETVVSAKYPSSSCFDVWRQRGFMSHPHGAPCTLELGARLVRVRGERIFLDELDPKAKGRPIRELSFECDLFCVEPTNQAAE